MRVSLFLVVALIILLAGIVGYILGTAPAQLTGAHLTNPGGDLAQSSLQNTTGEDVNKTQTADLPTLQSVLITQETSPLPLSLRAGLYFDAALAEKGALQISELGYAASVQQFTDQSNTLLYLVVLEPFKNEANLQLAKYELFEKHKIVTQRIVTPKKPKAAAN
ncbi:MAG: hypothetical protein AAF431_03805 [Pseudomonadota bacterium]